MRPILEILSGDFIEQIIAEAFLILEKTGITVENTEGRDILGDSGAVVEKKSDKVFIPYQLIEKSLQSTRKSVQVYDRNGIPALDLQGKNVYFDPGSSATNVYDYDLNTIRTAETKDFVDFTCLVNCLDNIKAQSTSIVCSDAPNCISDMYRLYISLICCEKPVVTGIFRKDSLKSMINMLSIIRGGTEELKKKPLAIFDACPTSPLIWSDLTCYSVIECARHGIPTEFIPMPLGGATAPVTLSGELVQHTVENISGIIISQCVNPGAPVIYGGSPTIFDMKSGSTPMGSIEAMMLAAGHNQIGKHLNLPTHSYMGLSDSKFIDYQGGFESGMGAVFAAMAGINVISGAGMHFFQQCLSMEKLVLDNEICGMAYRCLEGIEQRDPVMAKDLLDNLKSNNPENNQTLLTDDHTLKWFRDEYLIPGNVIDRNATYDQTDKTIKTSHERAHDEVLNILNKNERCNISEKYYTELHKIMKNSADEAGWSGLPEIRR